MNSKSNEFRNTKTIYNLKQRQSSQHLYFKQHPSIYFPLLEHTSIVSEIIIDTYRLEKCRDALIFDYGAPHLCMGQSFYSTIV
jgi:hypothetical protein